MKFVMFQPSPPSNLRRANPAFLQGVAKELVSLGHEVRTPAPGTDLDMALDGANVVIVHSSTSPGLITALGKRRAAGGRFTLLFRDESHSRPRNDLDGYDGVLAAVEAIRELYLAEGWERQVTTWHDAADTTLFRPVPGQRPIMDLVWIGGWDAPDAADLRKFLLLPVARLGLCARAHGAPFPSDIEAGLSEAGIENGGWLPSNCVPMAYASALMTVHIPRRSPDVLPGIAASRLFEALACGIPVVSAPWEDADWLFPSDCYLTANDTAEMTAALTVLRRDPGLREEMICHGLGAINARHSCAHRADELLRLIGRMQGVRPQTRLAMPDITSGPSPSAAR
jgi:spore maturation protein CgeB